MRRASSAVAALLILMASAAEAAPAACTTAAAACTEWVGVGTGPSRSLVYRTHALDAKNDRITRALVMVHGAGRDADNYFRTAVAAAFLAGALDDTLVIAPRFASADGGCRDALAAGEISWSCGGNSWRSGGPAAGEPAVTSYDLMDEILRRIVRKHLFPNVQSIVVAGHSAGGQYATRYGMANQVHDTLGVPVTYVVSNPSSYAWPDPERPAAGGDVAPFSDGRNCANYDRWPYGFQQRGGYTAKLTDEQLKKQLAARPVTYLLGGLDVLPLAGFDSSCPAMAQGPTRLARGEAFARYVNRRYSAGHTLAILPLCGHNARCMFTADPALEILFPPTPAPAASRP